ncbi:hypothetical protein FJZ36_16660 [Candidatus Poribacteria bacterium]|nr:hypothetical protein [Candidatus Poribacteria bacterium]
MLPLLPFVLSATPAAPRLPAIELARLSAVDAYGRFLSLWRGASVEQIDALRSADWKRFDAAVAYKSDLIEAWEAKRQGDEIAVSELQAPTEQIERWGNLIGEIQTLDREVQRVVRSLRDDVRAQLQQLDSDRRALRSYHSLPKNLVPRYIDRKL